MEVNRGVFYLPLDVLTNLQFKLLGLITSQLPFPVFDWGPKSGNTPL